MWIDGSILLNPSVNIATPRGWASVRPDALPRSKRYSEVHLVGGGTLLMWLLVKAKCAPFATDHLSRANGATNSGVVSAVARRRGKETRH